MSQHQDLVPPWEWEILSKPLRITVTDPGDLPETISEIVLQRGEDLDIHFEAVGALGRLEDLHHNVPVGVIDLDTEPTHGVCENHNLHITLFEKGMTKTKIGKDINIRGITNRIHVRSRKATTATSFTVWTIYGPPKTVVTFPRSTNREFTRELVRTRSGQQAKLRSTASRLEGSMDHAVLELPSWGSVVVAKALDGARRAEDYPMCLEFHSRRNTQPDNREWTGIINGLSFCFGKPLIALGWSSFDVQGYLVEGESWSPNTRLDRRINPRPPCRIAGHDNSFLVEKILNQLVESYDAQRITFRLDTALQLLWLAADVPIGTCHILYLRALETIAKAWTKNQKSLSNNGGVRKAVPKELRDQLLYFFEEIVLEVGVPERQVIDEGNKYETTENLSRSQIQTLVDMSHTFQTLLHRVILRLLGYQGPYIDYSTRGGRQFPERPLSEPAGGPRGDGTGFF